MSRRLFILGSTGSIGTNAVEVIRHLQQLDGVDSWEVVGLAAGRNAALLEAQAKLLSVSALALVTGAPPKATYSYRGPHAATELLQEHAKAGDLVLAAIVGFAGVAPVLKAIELGCDIALANKEALVAAGELVMQAAKQNDVRILPVDSEHSAIFQCLEGKPVERVRSIVLTASGGSLRDASREKIDTATVAEVLNHPTWQMGPKVTVDSATLMNKTLELVEAFWLFGVPLDTLHAVIHPQSLVHGLVEFVDGSLLAQLAPPDMKVPIQYALTWPQRRNNAAQTCLWTTLGEMNFAPIDEERFPSIKFAEEVIRTQGTAGAILSAANEVAVSAFLQQVLPLGSIERIVRNTLDAVHVTSAASLELVTAADQEARAVANGLVASFAGKEFA
ncbi:MAG: 1-deoxy-D-xylulose-5-phosphate reductoisomerase [Phycisphaerales bacterium]|jgi:1-deoxy-D-xylulose-5-phosphate reductoisomerase|nr:1-deoxy-D-xylulose-5-phosphate reductoisomerase [Phycisphaerales bacterium]